jgi:hypothetical protein
MVQNHDANRPIYFAAAFTGVGGEGRRDRRRIRIA